MRTLLKGGTVVSARGTRRADVLLENGCIKNPNITGLNKDIWIGRENWKYEKEFLAETEKGRWNLRGGSLPFSCVYRAYIMRMG